MQTFENLGQLIRSSQHRRGRQINTLMRKSFPHTFCRLNSSTTFLNEMEHLIQSYPNKSKQICSIVAYHNTRREVAGLVQIRWLPQKYTAVIANLCRTRTPIHKGLGSELLHIARRVAGDHRPTIETLLLHVRAENTRLQRFYGDLGWKRVGPTKLEGKDVVEMSWDLSDGLIFEME